MFNSIGDLNYNSAEYFFNTYSGSPIPIIPLVNTTGLENQFQQINNTLNLSLILIVFLFNILLFIYIQLKTTNPILIIFNLVFFIILHIKFWSIDEMFYGWICFIGWVLCLIDFTQIQE